jgi:hypothetical protein
MMGGWMARAGHELLADADALVPVPLHWRRRWARRYNQSAVLARAISAISGVPITHGGLKRVRATPQQVGRSRTERADNVQGAFLVPPEHRVEVAGRRLVLIDDVLTSGATVRPAPAHCCGRVLHRLMCWYSRGLWRQRELPYRRILKRITHRSSISTDRYCPHCNAAKALLKRKGVTYSESTSVATGNAATK